MGNEQSMNEIKYDVEYYWSMKPGKFLDKVTGKEPDFIKYGGPLFSGTSDEWLQCFGELISDCFTKLVKLHYSNFTGNEQLQVIVNKTIFMNLLSKLFSFTPSLKGFPEVGTVDVHIGTINKKVNVRIVHELDNENVILCELEDKVGKINILDAN